jgi:hypothetical protein
MNFGVLRIASLGGILVSKVKGPPEWPVSTLNVKYAWQKPVLDAFQERNPKNQLRKIIMAEQAVSDRLCNPAPFGVDERVALRKLLPVLRRLLHQTF